MIERSNRKVIVKQDPDLFQMKSKNNIQPLISVAMLTYNHEKYIADAINGVLKQQIDAPFELVIGEDKSTDDTRRIVSEFAEKYSSIIKPIYHDLNIGMMRNYIQVLSSCRGKFIAVCEGDDYWSDPEKLSKQVQYMIAHPEVSMSFHAVRMEYTKGRRKPWLRRARQKSMIITPEEVVIEGGLLFQLNSVMVRNEVISSLPNWFVDAPITDAPLALLALTKGSIGYIDEMLGVHRCDVDNSWSETSQSFNACLKYYEKLAVMRKGFNQYTDNKYSSCVRRRISKNYASLFEFDVPRSLKRIVFNKVKRDMMFWDRLIARSHIVMRIAFIKRSVKKTFGA